MEVCRRMKEIVSLQFSLLDGKARAVEDDHQVMLNKGKEALPDRDQLRARKLDVQAVGKDPLYRWSKLKNECASESNVNIGSVLLADDGWYGPGWYWEPFWIKFAFMPGAGIGVTCPSMAGL
jgi:hypothetical protein